MADDERPRWTLTWLFRIQRIGRPHGTDDVERPRGPWWTRVMPWLLLAIVGAETIVLVLLDVLPL